MGPLSIQFYLIFVTCKDRLTMVLYNLQARVANSSVQFRQGQRSQSDVSAYVEQSLKANFFEILPGCASTNFLKASYPRFFFRNSFFNKMATLKCVRRK